MISDSNFSKEVVRSRTEEKKRKRAYLRQIPTCKYSWQKRKKKSH